MLQCGVCPSSDLFGVGRNGTFINLLHLAVHFQRCKMNGASESLAASCPEIGTMKGSYIFSHIFL